MIKLISNTNISPGIFKPFNKAQQAKYPMPPFVADSVELPLIHDGSSAEIIICGGAGDSVLVLVMSKTKVKGKTVQFYRDDFTADDVGAAIAFAHSIADVADSGKFQGLIGTHKMTKREF